MVELRDHRIDNAIYVGEVEQEPGRLVDFPRELDRDAEAVPVKPLALVPVGESRQPVRRLKAVVPMKLDAHLRMLQRPASVPSPARNGIGRLDRILAPYRLLDRRVFLLAAARTVNTLGFSIVMPFMVVYLVGQRGATGATYGGIYLVAGVCAALSQGLAGELADRLGRRRVMVTALCLRSVNLLALGWAISTGVSMHALGALIVVNGVLRALFEPAASAAVADLTPPEHRIAAFGLQRIAINVAWAMGPAIGGFVAGENYAYLFLFAAPLTLGAALVAGRVRDSVRPTLPLTTAPRLTPRALVRLLRAHPAFATYLGLVFFGAVLAHHFWTLSIYAKVELGLIESQVGLLFTVNGLLVVLLQVPAVALIDTRGPRFALLAGPALYALAYVAVGFATGFGSLAIAVAILTAGEVIFSPALSDMAAHLGDPRRLGRAFGMFGVMQQLGLAMSPLVGGLLFDEWRGQHVAMWSGLAAGMAVVGVGYALFVRRFGVGNARSVTTIAAPELD